MALGVRQPCEGYVLHEKTYFHLVKPHKAVSVEYLPCSEKESHHKDALESLSSGVGEGCV